MPSESKIGYNRLKWTAAYLNAERFIGNYNYGVWRYTEPGGVATYTRMTSGTVPGFPDDTDLVIAIAESNGRMLYMTEKAIFWSAPADPDNLVPALGGAGFQSISERIGGIPIALMPVAGGAIIWTTAGALALEFIGGDFVFRFWVLNTELLPVSSFSVAKMATESHVIMTRLGLHACQNLDAPQPITPMFNEYMREFLRVYQSNQNHLWYSVDENRLYVGSRGESRTFKQTMTLDMGIDRWGLMNIEHIGIAQYAANSNQIGYANTAGIVSYILSGADQRKDRENPSTPNTFVGLDSYVVFGWMRATNLMRHPDMFQEMNELVVNRQLPFDDVDILEFDEELIADYDDADSVDEGLFADKDDVDTILVDEGYMTARSIGTNYKCTWLSDAFEAIPEYLEFAEIIPERVVANKFYDIWVGQQPAQYHRVKLSANALDEFYRVNTMSVNLVDMGRQI